MQVATEGIVLHKTKYSESSVIAQIFTREAGVQSFIVKGAFSKKNKGVLALLESLSVVEIKYEDRNQSIKFLQDISLGYAYSLIPFDMVRRTILIFYNEFIYKLLREYRADAALFDFIKKSLLELDRPDAVTTDIHLHFLVDLAKMMGFAPTDNYSPYNCHFFIDEATFIHEYLDNPLFLSQEASAYLNRLMHGENVVPIPPKMVRNELLEGLILYFEKHNEQIRKIDSVAILAQLM